MLVCSSGHMDNPSMQDQTLQSIWIKFFGYAHTLRACFAGVVPLTVCMYVCTVGCHEFESGSNLS